MESISNWLKNKGSYADGVALYAIAPGMKPTLLKVLQKGESATNREKLTYELKKVVPVQSFKPIIIGVDFGHSDVQAYTLAKKSADKVIIVAQRTVVRQPEAPAEPKPTTYLLYHQLPEALRPDLQLANKLFNDNCLLKTQLNELPAEMESEALAIQLKIWHNIKQAENHWARINFWQAHKRIPEAVVLKPENLNPFYLAKRQQNLFSSSSKLKTRLATTEAELALAVKVNDKTRLQKQLAKQTENLLKQEKELLEITALIDKRDGK